MKLSDKNTDKMLLGVAILSLALFLVSAGILAGYYIEYRNQNEQDRELSQLRDKALQIGNRETEKAEESGEESQSPEIIFSKMKEMNEDYIGWLLLEGAGVDNPVVQRDNSYYLNHDFYGEKNRHGCLFLDESCETEHKFLLIHGHNMKDGTMFGTLSKYLEPEFCEESDRIILEKERETRSYEVCAVLRVDLTREDFFHYERFPSTEEEAEKYMRGIKENAIWYKGTLPENLMEEKTHMIVLSTCAYGTEDERLLIIGISPEDSKIREEKEK